MAEALITDSSEFETGSVRYGKPVINKRGGKNIKVLDKNGNTLSIQYPLMLTWGVNEVKDMESGELRGYDMAVQFQDNDDVDVAVFRRKMEALEEKIMTDCMGNCKDWFNKAKMSRETAEEIMTPVLRYPKDKDTREFMKDRNPTLRFKLPYYDARFTTTEVYDLEGSTLFKPKGEWNKTPPQLVPKGCWTAGIIQCGGIYFASGAFGITWQLVQVMVRPPIRIQGQCFIKLSSSSRQKVEELNRDEDEQPNEEQVVEQKQTSTYVSDDEQEDNDSVESEDEREPTPPPAPVKKRVVRKKT
jgi:hypothetical protein